MSPVLSKLSVPDTVIILIIYEVPYLHYLILYPVYHYCLTNFKHQAGLYGVFPIQNDSKFQSAVLTLGTDGQKVMVS